jgi:NADPH:quinone reductase-like Zn-dependent oxidoreductase
MDAIVMMKAAVIYEAGGPEVLKLEVLIRIKAFGLNRSELFTRQGHSPGVKFPRVLGIEACGVVEEAPGGQFKKNQIVATAMGGMVRIAASIFNICVVIRVLTSFRRRVVRLMVVTPSSLAFLLPMCKLWRRSSTGRQLVPFQRCSRQHMGHFSKL